MRKQEIAAIALSAIGGTVGAIGSQASEPAGLTCLACILLGIALGLVLAEPARCLDIFREKSQ